MGVFDAGTGIGVAGLVTASRALACACFSSCCFLNLIRAFSFSIDMTKSLTLPGLENCQSQWYENEREKNQLT